MSGRQDTGYKLLFSHPEMIRDLLTGFVPGDWIADADFSTLERDSASFVSDTGKQRHDDMIWRVRVKDRWLWVYLLLEFQNRPERWMAVRMLVYVGLLAQDLIRRNELHDGQLPPILPLVLYRGEPRWRALLDARDCFVTPPVGLEPFLPALRYYVVDEARLRLHPAEAVRNFAEALFTLEQGRTPADIRPVLRTLNVLLHDDSGQSLRRAFDGWTRVLLKRMDPDLTIDDIDDLLEGEPVLEQRLKTWLRDTKRQAIAEGFAEGKAELLERLLTRRFGAVPAWAVERLRNATAAQLDSWAERLLDVATLDEVFSESAGPDEGKRRG